MIFTTNQDDIADYAKYCYVNNPTVVNNVPKEKNCYDYSMYNHAIIDNNLAKSQIAIGESSNIAQLALTYSYTFTDKNYLEYADILACIAQICIDNSKRRYDIDLNSEIRRIKSELDIKIHGYPRFWLYVNYTILKEKINHTLQCPMNVLFDYKPPKIRSNESTLPMCYFYNYYPLKDDRRKSKRVEGLIEDFGLKLYHNAIDDIDDDLILRDDFDRMIESIKRIYISKEYLGLFSWLIDRAFHMKTNINGGVKKQRAKTEKNKVLLLKTLYTINPTNLLKIFQKTT